MKLNPSRIGILHHEQLTNVLSFIIGVLIFVGVFGPFIVNPFDTGWCVAYGGDISQSYLAWKSYRISEWFFPWGMQNNLAYPSETSCVFTFCAPLLSFLFKLLSPILPAEFQFAGIFGACSFGLQALFTCWIVKLYSDNKVAQVLVPAMFLFVPVLIYRWMGHSFMGADWLLLLAIFALLDYRRYSKGHRVYAVWFALGVLSAGIQMYWCLFCGFILVGYCIADVMTYKTIKRSVGCIASFLLSAILITLLLGGFSSLPETQSNGLGIYGANLNALFDSQGWSQVLPDLPKGEGQYEGLAYLGAGFIVLFILAMILLITSNQWKEIIHVNKALIIAIICCCVISFLFALSPTVMLNDQVVLQLPLPNIVEKAWAMFRATGRFMWIPVYFIMICSVAIVLKCSAPKISFLMLCCCLCLQIWDIYPNLKFKHHVFARPYEYSNPYDADETLKQMLETGHAEHLIYTCDTPWDDMRELDDWALSNHLTLNTFYFPRDFTSLIEANTEAALTNPTEHDIFAFPESDVEKCFDHDLNYYPIDGFVIGVTYELPNSTPLTESELLDLLSEQDQEPSKSS